MNELVKNMFLNKNQALTFSDDFFKNLFARVLIDFYSSCPNRIFV